MIEVDGMKAYTVKETAEILHLTVWSVRKYIRDGKLKARKLGTKYYILSDEIKELVRRGAEVREHGGDKGEN